MTSQAEEGCPGVPGKAKQGQETPDWTWVEPSVWTVRMLAALSEGVKGGKWFSLIDKVWRKENLQAAFRKVKANGGAAGVDHQSIEDFERRLEWNLANIRTRLQDGTYQPQSIRRVWIPKPGKKKEMRPLGIPTVRDRVIQTALRNVIEPIFEKDFVAGSFGFRPRKSCKDALRRMDQLMKKGYRWVLDADIRSYFDRIPHAKLLSLVGEKIADTRVLKLVEAYLNQGVMEGMEKWTPEEGTPQGAVISPLLANVYLHPLDVLMAAKGFLMIRYADDVIVLCRTKEECAAALAIMTEWTVAAGLELHPDKTVIREVTEEQGVDFLGYHHKKNERWPRQKSLKKMKDTIRAETKRQNGKSMEEIIRRVNRILRGWFNYFKHSHRFIFERLDRWIRVRLRSILRKRSKRRGRCRGSDHVRWPNAYFGTLGLFFLTAAWEDACQSVKR